MINNKDRKIRSLGEITIHDARGYGYFLAIVRRELDIQGKGKIPFYIDANCILLVRIVVTSKDIIEGLYLLKKDLKL